MRLKLLSPVLAIGLVAAGLGVMTATSSHASPVKLYFHSATGGYLADWEADPDSFDAANAPKGSTTDAKAPTKTTDSFAQSTSPYRWSGLPTQPSFSLPFAGDVTSVCLDVWLKSTESAVAGINVSTNFYTPANTTLGMVTATAAPGSGILRLTALVKPSANAPKHTIPKDTELIIAGFLVDDPDFTLVYDSVAHPSSITINATECKPTPVVVPSATASATPAPSASASATATPAPSASASATATPAPSGSASATSTPSASATATPAPTTAAPTTPPPPARETSIDYTGPSGARYSDLAIVSARMSLPDGSPVPAGTVEFTLGTVVVHYPVNSNGVASGRLPVKVAPGQHVITARYLANSAYLGTAEQAPFSVSRMPARCAISRTTSGGNYVVTATLRDAAGKALVNQAVNFLYNGRTWKALRTDRTGRASATIAAKRGTYTVAMATTTYYTGCSASFRV